MALTAKETTSIDRPLIEAGVHIATCYLICDIGTHHNDVYEKDAHQVVLGWEIPEQRADFTIDGVKKNLPLVVTKTFTVSLHKKAGLRLVLEAWRGKPFTDDELRGFDLKNVMGKSCQIQIMHKTNGDKTYANIAALMPLPKGMKPPAQETPSQWFALEENGPIPDNIPKWLVDKIHASKEWIATNGPAAQPDQDTRAETVAAKLADDVPGDADLPF
jgi:hypothetical protein